jgi:hypothetical protein
VAARSAVREVGFRPKKILGIERARDERRHRLFV